MTKRTVYFDYLRVVAIIAVIVIHTVAQSWSGLDARSFDWNVMNFYDSIVRWGVPIFIMISGALFLSMEIEIGKLYKKYISRLLVAYVVWSVCYAVVIPLAKSVIAKGGEISLHDMIISAINGGYYHMWFIPMIIGLYMCVPILKEIVRSESAVRCFLVLSFIFSFIIPQVVSMSNDFIGGTFAEIVNEIDKVVDDYMGLHLVLGFSFYFVLGYYLNRTELTKKQRGVVYILGAVGFVATIVLSSLASWRTGVPSQTYYDNFSVNVLLEAIALHTWFKYKDYKSDKLNSFFLALSKYSFGAYLIHYFVILTLNEIGIGITMCTPIVSVPVISVIAVIASFLISWVLNKIPIVNKWLV